MDDTPTTADLKAATGISLSYASEIASGKRQPSRPLAIHIFRKTGWRHECLEGLTEDQIDTLESIEPWTARTATRDDAQAAA